MLHEALLLSGSGRLRAMLETELSTMGLMYAVWSNQCQDGKSRPTLTLNMS